MRGRLGLINFCEKAASGGGAAFCESDLIISLLSLF